MSMIIGNVDENDSFDRREGTISPGVFISDISPRMSQSAFRGLPAPLSWRSGPRLR